MSSNNNEENISLMKTQSNLIFTPFEKLPIELLIDYFSNICMNNLHKEWFDYLEEGGEGLRVYQVGWDDYDEEGEEEGSWYVRENNTMLIQLENLKERGIKWISEYDSSTDEQKQTTKENYGDEAERLGMIIGNDGITFH